MINIPQLTEHIYDVVGAIFEVHKELGPGLNEYVYQVCKYGTDWKTDKESGKTTLDYHGYRWYKGKAGTYDSWDSEYWTHNGGGYDDRVKRDASIASACEKACTNKFD